jgi:hypothetical protein
MAEKQKSSYDGRHDSSYLDQQKMLMAEKNATDLKYFVESPYLNIEQIKWALTMTTPPTNMSGLRAIFDDINSYLDGKKTDGAGNKITDPYKDAVFRRKFTDYLLQAYVELSPMYDSVTQVAMRRYMLPEGKIRFEMTKPEFFTVWRGRGKLCNVTGVKESGKTDVVLKIAEGVLAKKNPVNGNIEMTEPVENYTYCRRFSKMMRAICKAEIKGQTSLTLMDETLLQFASFLATTKEWKQMSRFCILTRKLGNDQFWIAQYAEKIPEVFRDYYDAWIHKEAKRKMRYEIKTGEYRGIYEVEGVERTNLPFDTKHISGMIIDVPINEILEFLDTIPTGGNQPAEILNFLDAKERAGWEHLTEWQKELMAPYLMKMVPELSKYKDAPKEEIVKGVAVLLDASKKKVFGWLGNHGLDVDLKSIEEESAS